LKPSQRLVYRQHLERIPVKDGGLLHPRAGSGPTATFESPMSTCAIDDDPVHRHRDRGKEMSAILELAVAACEPQIGLVHEGRRRERFPRRLARQPHPGKAVDLVVHHLPQPFPCVPLSAPDGGEELGDQMCRLVGHGSPQLELRPNPS